MRRSMLLEACRLRSRPGVAQNRRRKLQTTSMSYCEIFKVRSTGLLAFSTDARLEPCYYREYQSVISKVSVTCGVCCLRFWDNPPLRILSACSHRPTFERLRVLCLISVSLLSSASQLCSLLPPPSQLLREHGDSSRRTPQ